MTRHIQTAMRLTPPSLNTVANVALACACLATAGVATNRFLDGHYGLVTSAGTAERHPVSPGTRVLPIDGVSFASASVTVALVVQSECRFCSDSMPFYRELSKLRAKDKVQLVVLSRESLATTEHYLKARQLAVDRIAQLKGAEIPVSGTPTLLLIGKTGTVQDSWLGRLTPAQEEEVSKQIVSRS